jgi:hypothetical protein
MGAAPEAEGGARVAVVLAAIALAAAALGCGESEAVREQKVRAAYADYKKAAMSGDGAAAAALLSSITVNHFGHLRDLALHASADEVKGHSAVNQLSIFRLRHFVAAEELATWSAEKTLAHALSNGWIGRDLVAQVELGRVELHGGGALGEVLVNGFDNGWWHILLEEDGRWRFELLQGYGISESEFSGLARDHGLGKTELVLAVLRAQAGGEIDPERLLQPLVAPVSPAG